MEFVHKPVLLHETIEYLNVNPNGIYIDGTAGGGGHSSEIAKRLKNGRLVCIDQDPEAIETLTNRFKNDNNVTIYRSNFSQMREAAQELGITSVDGVLLDIGVSSRQFDTPERGFSYHHNAPLDMRMSKDGTTAADLVNTLSFNELCRILTIYGEEKFAKNIVRAIEQRRVQKPIETTLELAEIVANAYPAKARRDGHPARKTFQALRIAVNGELDRLSEGLDAAFSLLKVGGKLAVITFHSLEDRIVKQRMAKWCEGCICPKDFPVCICGKTPSAKLVTRKPLEAAHAELEENPRSRSAKLRVCEKIRN